MPSLLEPMSQSEERANITCGAGAEYCDAQLMLRLLNVMGVTGEPVVIVMTTRVYCNSCCDEIPYNSMLVAEADTTPRITINLAVRDFAVPVPRIGSIEVNSGYNLLPAGQEIHSRIQKERRAANSTYRSEQKLAFKFARDEFVFNVSGRLDGIFFEAPPVIEEIKSALSIVQLKARLIEQPDHPYLLQLRTYGYIYHALNSVTPKLRLLLASSASTETEEFPVEANFSNYEQWLDRRLAELVVETREQLANIARRKEVAALLTFPFKSPRQGQKEMIEWIEQRSSGESQMLIQAPTGLGKTVGVMYPMLKDALSRGQKVVYVTPKNSQHSVAQDAVERMRCSGGKIKSTTLNAKAKLCFKPEPVCNPEYCEFARDYYAKVHNNNLVSKLNDEENLTAETFIEYGEKYQVCPFELSLDSLQSRDVIIGDYNYVFSPRSLLGRIGAETPFTGERPNLIVDEAHNLPGRACDYYSPELSSATLKEAVKKARTLSPGYALEAEAALNQALHTLDITRVHGAREGAISPNPDAFSAVDQALRDFLSRYLQSGFEIERKDALVSACQSWSQFTDGLGYDGDQFFATFFSTAQSVYYKITCCDASQQLENAYNEFANVVAFSATIKPFEYYSRLSGFKQDKLHLAEFESPFPAENRKVLIIPQVSTKYSDRQSNYSKIAAAIKRITAVRPGNYLVFFPSFEFLEAVLAQTTVDGFTVMAQRPDMKASEVHDWLACLKELGKNSIIFAVQGGVLSEGIDYPGETIIGALVVGPAIPKYNLERELIRKYYEKTYSSGFDYAYTFPAMTRVVQAAGRVIRSETDKGLIVLMDRRFVQDSYTKSMPKEWFDSSVSELVSNSILKDVEDFWRSTS